MKNTWQVVVVKPQWKLQVVDIGLGGGTIKDLNLNEVELLRRCVVLSVKLWVCVVGQDTGLWYRIVGWSRCESVLSVKLWICALGQSVCQALGL